MISFTRKDSQLVLRFHLTKLNILGTQRWDTPTHGKSPVGDPVVHLSAERQVTGEAIYTDDLPKRPNELIAVMLVSDVPHAKILEIGMRVEKFGIN